MSAPSPQLPRKSGRDLLVAFACGGFVAVMVGLVSPRCRFIPGSAAPPASAAPRKYRVAAPTQVPGRTITVRFDSNVAPGLPWQFEPERRTVDVKLGEVVTVYYSVTNEAARVTSGQAGYNVTPPTAGIYFEKINCFCFTQQTMKPGEKRDMAVVFYVDPKLAKDLGQDTLSNITLSYTFYPVKTPEQPVAESAVGEKSGHTETATKRRRRLRRRVKVEIDDG